MTDNIRSYLLKDHIRYTGLPFHIQPAKHNQDFHLHRHDFTELTLVLEGRGTHIVSGHAYPIGPGNVFALPPGRSHSFSAAEGLRIINIMFSWDSPLMDRSHIDGLAGFHQLFTIDPMLRDSGSYKEGLTLKGEKWDDILEPVYRMLNEYNRGAAGFEGILSSCFQMLIITLSREENREEKTRGEESRPIARAMAYLQENYRRRITAEELAETAHVSSRHLSRIFNSLLNTTPFEYLADLRLKEAHKMLSETEKTITEVAESCGFSDSNYFAQVFKKRFGMSPREYKNRSGGIFPGPYDF
ncbi:MAG: AraC family transcriptional regulator [Spirochaetales bacterium]|nr:AraC family transcriptional regulator [Spirochaetales bacterium]